VTENAGLEFGGPNAFSSPAFSAPQFLQAGRPSCHPTNSVKALSEK